ASEALNDYGFRTNSGSFDIRRDPHVRWRLSSSGSFAIFTAIRLASSRFNNLAADLRPRLILKIDIGERLSVVVTHDETGSLLDGPGRRKAVVFYDSPPVLLAIRARFSRYSARSISPRA